MNSTHAHNLPSQSQWVYLISMDSTNWRDWWPRQKFLRWSGIYFLARSEPYFPKMTLLIRYHAYLHSVGCCLANSIMDYKLYSYNFGAHLTFNCTLSNCRMIVESVWEVNSEVALYPRQREWSGLQQLAITPANFTGPDSIEVREIRDAGACICRTICLVTDFGGKACVRFVGFDSSLLWIFACTAANSPTPYVKSWVVFPTAAVSWKHVILKFSHPSLSHLFLY